MAAAYATALMVLGGEPMTGPLIFIREYGPAVESDR